MSDPFVAEIRIFGFNYAPRGWAFCNGQLLPIMQNTALFSLLGTTYGGDGKTTFALPNLQGRAPMHQGQGPGLSGRTLGENSGEETVTLATTEMPSHTHTIQGKNDTSFANASGQPAGRVFGKSYARATSTGYAPGPPNVQMNAQAIAQAGGGLPHNNLQPYLTFNFCIALQGIFPPRG